MSSCQRHSLCNSSNIISYLTHIVFLVLPTYCILHMFSKVWNLCDYLHMIRFCAHCPLYILFNFAKSISSLSSFQQQPLSTPLFYNFECLNIMIFSISNSISPTLFSTFFPFDFFRQNFISPSTFRKYLWCELLSQYHSLPNYSDIISYEPLNTAGGWRKQAILEDNPVENHPTLRGLSSRKIEYFAKKNI